MRKLLVNLLVIACFSHALEYSHRIQALGTDFAYLIPDYETDLYRNPQILGEKIGGISCGPILTDPAYYYPVYTEPWREIPLQPPIKVALLSRIFGLYGEYISGYYHDTLHYGIPSQYEWAYVKQYVFQFENLGMVKIKDDVWNIYGDVYIQKNEYVDSYNYNVQSRISEYFIKTQTSFNIGKFLNLDIKTGAGFFRTVDETNDFTTKDQHAAIPTFRVGLYYRNVLLSNKFTSWFVDIGGPMSRSEVLGLPYSIYLNLHNRDRYVIYFAHTFTSNVGWAKGIPIDSRGLVIIGIREKFLYQKTEDVERDNNLHAITNRLSFPVGVEWIINQIAIRFGTAILYNLESMRAWDTETDIRVHEKITHTIDYDYSFGLGWKPTERLVIDLYSRSPLRSIRDWAIYVKYLF